MRREPELPLFALDVNARGADAVLVLHGELDLWIQPQFASALARAQDRFARVVLDLADVHFIDGANLILIHQALERAQARGTDLVLRSPNPELSRVLELTGLSSASGQREVSPIVLPLPSRAYEHAIS